MRRISPLVVAALILLTVGAAAVIGVPMVDLSGIQSGSASLIPLLVLAGLADGVNPCAFSTLLVFAGALMGYLGGRMQGAETPGAIRKAVLQVGLAYTAGIFGIYLLTGLGLFSVGQSIPAGAVPWVLRVSGFVVIIMGLVMVREYFEPQTPIRLGIPRSLHQTVRRYAHATTVGGALVAGAVIGLCAVPCSGAVYLGVISLLTVYGWAKGAALLLLYNVAFVLPVLALLLTVTSRPALRDFTRWYLRYRSLTKLGLGLFVILIGFLVIWTA